MPVSAATAPPATDPALDPAQRVTFLPGPTTHPRLLFDAAELSALQTAVQSQPVKAHYDKLLGYLSVCVSPGNTNFKSNATEAQRQGLWRMPTVALHYALTGNTTSFNRTKAFMDLLLGAPNWETGSEIDSGMGAGNMMVGAALAYDWLYNDLDPVYREQYRQKLFYHARAMYHLGHLGGAGGYWQGDPQNNHRWHRNAGLALCMLAAYAGNPEEEWMLRQVFDELAFVATWLPPDGTSHESPTYLVFGASHLMLALQAADNCLGTNYLDQPFFAATAGFRAQTIAPGFNHFFLYGDVSDDTGGYNHFSMLAAARHNQPDTMNALDELFSRRPNAFDFGWFGVLWRGNGQTGGDYQALPRISHYEDLGLTFMREGWNAGDAAAMFKSGPFGGKVLNDYRIFKNYAYVNVAHDDPDANSFILFKDDEWVAETSRYSYSKKTANHNSLLVDGKGQRASGRPEGGQWSQPATGSSNMKDMAFVTWEEDNVDTVITEGEAGNSYPEISRFRRSFIWRTGKYVLVLDDVRASQNRALTWLIQSGTVTTRDAAALKFTLVKNSTNCEFQVASTRTLGVAKATSPADNRNNILGWEQLKLTTTTDNAQFASAYDLWDAGNLQVSLSQVTATGAQVNVTGTGISESWKWTFATSPNTASTIELMAAPTLRSGPVGEDVEVNESAELNVERGGLGALNYQWYQGAVGDISTPVGGNSPTLETPALAENASFWVRVSSDYGTVDSPARLVHLTSGFFWWAGQTILSGSQAADGDADSDNLTNFLEYALGTDPKSGQMVGNLPAVAPSAGWLEFRFSVPTSGLADVRYEVQVAEENFTGWTTVLTKTAGSPWTGSAAFTEDPAVEGQVPVNVKIAPLGGGEAFCRLKVTRM